MRIILFPYKVAKNIRLELAAWTKLIVKAWPDGPLGHKLRWSYWRRNARLAGAGNMARMADIVHPSLTSIGANFVCGEYSVVNSSDSLGIFIGNNVMLGPRVYMRSANHNFTNISLPINKQGHSFAKIPHNGKDYSIVIEDDVWIGANCIILSGVRIGKGSVIGAGSVVTSEIPAFSIAAGSPAKVIKMRQ